MGMTSPLPHSLLALWGEVWPEGGQMQALGSTVSRAGFWLFRFKTGLYKHGLRRDRE